MNVLPDNLSLHRRTPDFTHEVVPGNLLKNHKTAKGVWAIIKVSEGQLIYRILEPSFEEHFLTATKAGIIEPQVNHEVEIRGAVKFYIEFYH